MGRNGCPPVAPIVPLEDDLPGLDGRVLVCVIEPPSDGFWIVLKRTDHALEVRVRVTDPVHSHAPRPYALGTPNEARRSLGSPSDGSRVQAPEMRPAIAPDQAGRILLRELRG